MASLVYDSFWDDLAKGNVDPDTDSFKALLAAAGYVADKGAHTKRSDVTNEVTGTGYTEGGAAVTVTVTKDTTNHRVDIGLGAASWTGATITAAHAVYYKARGGLASADELVANIDFGGNITATSGTFSLAASTIRIQN